MVLTFGIQTVEQFCCSRPLIGFKFPGPAQVHQRIGFFGASGHHAPGTVIFEGSTDQHLVIGQKS